MTVKTKKPPTQTAGVNGIDAHGPMGAQPEKRIDFNKLTKLPAFEMFVLEQSGQQVGTAADEWVSSRRNALGDSGLFERYAAWHADKGLWADETPFGTIK